MIENLIKEHNLGACINDKQHIIVKHNELLKLLKLMRDEIKANILIDLFAADFLYKETRFEIVYNLLSLNLNQRFTVKILLKENEKAPSVTPIFLNACWYEREVFDMFGIEFIGLKDSRRILTDYGFHGHPLRKDFPLSGYVQVTYDERQEKVVYEPVNLDQEFRTFNFLSPWQQNVLLPGDEKASKE